MIENLRKRYKEKKTFYSHEVFCSKKVTSNLCYFKKNDAHFSNQKILIFRLLYELEKILLAEYVECDHGVYIFYVEYWI